MELVRAVTGLPLIVVVSCKLVWSALVYCSPVMTVVAPFNMAEVTDKVPPPPTWVIVTVGQEGLQLYATPLLNKLTVMEKPGDPTVAVAGALAVMEKVCARAGKAKINSPPISVETPSQKFSFRTTFLSLMQLSLPVFARTKAYYKGVILNFYCL